MSRFGLNHFRRSTEVFVRRPREPVRHHVGNRREARGGIRRSARYTSRGSAACVDQPTELPSTVARRPEAVVITWITTEPAFWVHGVRPEKPLRFQTVLHADGRIAFSYADVTLGDGIVGLFPHDEVAKGDLVASVVDGADPDRPGHIDLLDASIYASNGDAVILEFTLREAVPDPPAGSRYSYRLHVDTDEPYWSHPVDWSDEDFTWQVDLRPGGERAARGAGRHPASAQRVP